MPSTNIETPDWRRDMATILEELNEGVVAALGNPTEQRSGFFVWDAIEGNVVLQTAESTEGFSVNLYLTSKSVRNFKRK